MTAPFDFFKYRNGVLSSDHVPLDQIAEAHGTPCYVYSSEAFLAPLRELQKGLASVDHLVCFALKSNSNIGVLKLLAENGAGMDLVSGGELFRAIRAGVSPQKIVFSGVGKTPAEMEEGLNRGIYAFNVESTAELAVLNGVAKRMGKTAPVSFRFNPDVDAKTHPYISTGLKKNKFGIPRADILGVMKNLKDYPNIEIRGIDVHIGSQLVSLSPLEEAFKHVRSLMAEMEKYLPKPLMFIDLGGGVGITYKNEKPPALSKYCQLILKYFGPKAGLKNPVRILIEPGRTLSGNSGILLTRVLYRKMRGKKSFLVVDAAMNDLIRPALYGSFHDIVPVNKKQTTGKMLKTDIVGPVCESSDCFASDRSLSQTLKDGDLMAILSAGAYGFTMASNYNSRPRPAEVLTQGSEKRVIRDRETYDDLIRGEHF